MSFILLLLLFSAFGFSGISTVSRHKGNATDRLALLAIKSNIKQDPYGILSSWNASSNINFCQWYGVTCGHKHHRVTRLDLANQTLTGSISPFIGNLSFLRVLDLGNNSFGGAIPQQITNLKRIESLLLRNNSLVGNLPRNLSACYNLIYFNARWNKLVGEIPPELGSLPRLEKLYMNNNELTGEIPTSFGNLSSLTGLLLYTNQLTGNIPSTLGMLTNLVYFILDENMFSGTIPSNIFNLSNIVVFDVGYNQLQGVLPSYIGNTFPRLAFLSIFNNNYTGSIPISLSNASELIEFDASNNALTGQIPRFEKSSKLINLGLEYNHLGNGTENDLSFFSSLINSTNLESLGLSSNNLGDIGKLQNLQALHLYHNNFSGNIPSSLGNLRSLIYVNLADNNLHGNIPTSLGNWQNVQEVNLSGNNLSGPIPLQLFGLSSLSIHLDISSNHISGSLPSEVGQLKDLGELFISHNLLAGSIPSTLGSCIHLEVLQMQGNFFQGKIPSSFATLRGLQSLDISRNNISGPIPDFLGELKLQHLNLSFNNFEGEVPNKGIFKNASAVFVNGNNRLCGVAPELKLPVCINKGSKNKSKSSTYKLVVIIIVAFFGLTLMSSFLLFFWLKRKRSKKTLEFSYHVHYRVSYQSLVAATDGFSSANKIGSGGFGSVYRGNFEDGSVVAVKVLNLEHDAAAKSFIAECDAFKNIRHRNIVKLLTVCSSIDYQGNDFKAVVYEFMVNGNLDEWLHPVQTEEMSHDDQQRHGLNLLDRLNIAIDVISALNYLHNDCEPPILHCDIKPSNILLDNEMIAHVGDFGLSRFIINQNSDAVERSSIGVRGTIGYTPPEYGLGSGMSKAGDVYSFGILLLELITGKRPTDDIFKESHNLHQYAQIALANNVIDIADNLLLQDDEDCLISAVKIGVACSLDSPKDRPSTTQVLRELQLLITSL